VIGRAPDQLGAFGGMHRQRKERHAATHRLLVFDQFDAQAHGQRDAIPKPHLGEVARGQRRDHRAIAPPVVGRCEIDRTARKQTPRQGRRHVHVLNRRLEGGLGPAIERHVHQGRVQQLGCVIARCLGHDRASEGSVAVRLFLIGRTIVRPAPLQPDISARLGAIHLQKTGCVPEPRGI
jgi:hypothetical protein